MQIAELLSRRRRRLVVASAIGFLVLQVALATRGIMHPEVHLVMGVLGLALFAGCLFAAHRIGSLVRGTPSELALNDEMTQHNRLAALATGFWSMLVLAISVFAAAELLRLNIHGGAVSHTILTVGVVAALVRFALLEGLLERD